MVPQYSVANVTLTGGTSGTYTFADKGPIPLLSRRVEHTRASEQGFATRKIVVTLSGYFTGDRHSDIVDAYQSLIAFLRLNDVKMTYSAGSGSSYNLSNQVMYVDQYNEPTDWKQFSGDYEIQFHYFETYDTSNSSMGIAASYTSVAGSYTFDMIPQWAHSQHPIRTNYGGPTVTPGGQTIASERHITLAGRITAAGHSAVAAKVNALTAAFQADGVLDYGSWSNSVFVVALDIPTNFPRDYCDYTIELAYYTTSVYKFDFSISPSRIHQFPLIRENLFCGTRSIQTFGNSGQVIDYNYQVWGPDTATCRAALSQECLNTIVPGGIEMPGGGETWDSMGLNVGLKVTKFYSPAVIPNLTGTDI